MNSEPGWPGLLKTSFNLRSTDRFAGAMLLRAIEDGDETRSNP